MGNHQGFSCKRHFLPHVMSLCVPYHPPWELVLPQEARDRPHPPWNLNQDSFHWHLSPAEWLPCHLQCHQACCLPCVPIVPSPPQGKYFFHPPLKVV